MSSCCILVFDNNELLAVFSREIQFAQAVEKNLADAESNCHKKC